MNVKLGVAGLRVDVLLLGLRCGRCCARMLLRRRRRRRRRMIKVRGLEQGQLEIW
jgi:hypothetical protein